MVDGHLIVQREEVFAEEEPRGVDPDSCTLRLRWTGTDEGSSTVETPTRVQHNACGALAYWEVAIPVSTSSPALRLSLRTCADGQAEATRYWVPETSWREVCKLATVAAGERATTVSLDRGHNRLDVRTRLGVLGWLQQDRIVDRCSGETVLDAHELATALGQDRVHVRQERLPGLLNDRQACLVVEVGVLGNDGRACEPLSDFTLDLGLSARSEDQHQKLQNALRDASLVGAVESRPSPPP